MRKYSGASWERAMKREEIILRAYAGKMSWIQAAEVLGMSCRHLLRLREKYAEWGFDGLHDGRVGKESPRRMPVAVVEEVLRLYRDEYFDFSVVHFHEKLVERHSMTVSYTWVKALLQGSGLVAKDRPRKKHRRRRERKPLKGMMLHIDGSSGVEGIGAIRLRGMSYTSAWGSPAVAGEGACVPGLGMSTAKELDSAAERPFSRHAG